MRRVRTAALASVALIAATLAGGPTGPALAADVSREQAAALAGAAAADPAALAELKDVTAIDGVPADPGVALAGAAGDELAARLAALQRALAAPRRGEADADAARADAESIVSGFPTEEQDERTGTGADQGSGDGLSLDLGALWIPLLIVAVIAGALIGVRLARNREAAGRLAAEGDREQGEEGIDELALRAGQAEDSGRWAEALRLRYAIALRALQESGAVPAAPSVTPARVSRELGDPRADRLVGTFERVVYGGRPAAAGDAREAREGWPTVVRERGGDRSRNPGR